MIKLHQEYTIEGFRVKASVLKAKFLWEHFLYSNFFFNWICLVFQNLGFIFKSKKSNYLKKKSEEY